MKKGLKVANIEQGSMAEKSGIIKGDFIISIDDIPVKEKDDIINAIKDKTDCKIYILRDGLEKTIDLDNVKDFIENTEFEEENVFSNCEKKAKSNKFLLITALIGVLLIIGISTVILVKKNTISKNKDEKSSLTTIEQKREIIKETEKQNIFLMDEQTKKKLIKEIERKKQELPAEEKINNPRAEEIIDENFELDNFDKELKKELEKLYDEQNKDDDNPFGAYGSNRSPNEKENKGGSGLGKNDTLSDKPAEEKAIRVFFNYGSHLETNGFSMARYLKGNQTIETAADIEYAEFCVAINDFIKSIPDEKRNKATFSVVGYTDTSFRNKIPDKGEESLFFNRELSLKRAKSVAKMLIMELGIDSNKILSPQGRGFEKLIRENGKENHDKSRRVEVYCLWK